MGPARLAPTCICRSVVCVAVIENKIMEPRLQEAVSALLRKGSPVAFAHSTPRVSAGAAKPRDAGRRDRRSTITARQLAVAALVVRGLSNPEVARVLDISINTVKKHVRDLFERCEVASRAELAARLVANGIVDLVYL